MLDSVIRVNKKCYHQTLLKECKSETKMTKIENLINDDLGPSSPDESDSEFDNRSDNMNLIINLLRIKKLVILAIHLLGFYLCQSKIHKYNGFNNA